MSTRFGLVVDDDPQVRGLFAEVLRRAGLPIVEAQSGNEALRLARSTDLAFVVTDIDMPDGDGWDLCRELRASTPTCRLPIVVVSGTSHSQDDEAIKSGCDVVLRKPCSPAQLLATIRRLIDRSQHGDGPDLDRGDPESSEPSAP